MAVLFTVLCGMAALSLGYFINYFTTGHFVHSTKAALDARAALIETSDIPANGVEGQYLYRALDDKGAWPTDIPQIERFSEGVIVFDYPENNRRYAAKIYDFDDQSHFLIAFDITEIAQDFRFMQILGICSIIFVMIVVFVSFIISVFVVSGTNKIASTAQEIIETGDLSRRLEFDSRWDDLSNMAVVLNSLLARIEDLMIGVRRVSDNIAHDLRTPLTRMRHHIETLENKYGHDDYAELLNEADHLLSTFTALLRISRIESEQQRSHFSTLDLTQILMDVIGFYEPLAEDKGITISMQTIAAELTGDKDLLFQAYANIIDNAIKFTPKGGKIKLVMREHNDQIEVVIEDSGPGVDEDEISKIFDRFYRAEQSRSSAGTGLGLSLAKVVVELHGGRIYATNTDTGLRIITIL